MSRRPELRRQPERRADLRLEEQARRELRLAKLGELRRLTSEIDPAIPHIARVVHPRLATDWQRGAALLDDLERLA